MTAPSYSSSSRSCWSSLLADCSTLWIMATVAVCGGFVVNQFRDAPLPLVYASKADRLEQAVERIAQAAPKSCPSVEQELPTAGTITSLDLAAFLELQEREPQALILDARPEIFHRLGHIPKALSLPREAFEEAYQTHKDALEKEKARPVLIYCSGEGCEDAQMVADALLKLHFLHLYVFKGGWEKWTQAQLPEEKNAKNL